MYTGPHLIKDNLIFGYDTGYGVADNNTSTRFYPGEPTVNSLASTAVGSSGITFGSDSGGTFLETNSGTTGYNYIKVPNITVSSNETYTWSFELKSTETITQSGNKYYFDTNEFSNEFSTSNDQSRVSSSQVRPSSLPANEWVKFALTVTMKPNLTGAYSYDFLNFIKPHFTSKKIYYRNMQFEHNKSHHTPFVAGTRSSTQSLIDLKRSTDIDVSNVSFSSTGQPEFDGTDDYIQIPDPNVSSSSGFSIEMIIKPTNASSSPMIITPNSGGIDHFVRLGSNGRLYMRMIVAADSSVQDFTTTTLLSSTDYHYVVFTFKQSEGGKAYYNGSQESAASANFTALDWSSVWRIGQRGNNTFFFDGELPILKVHNEVLTADQVKQNYNAYKNRFDI